MQHKDQNEHYVHEEVGIEEDRSDERNAGQTGDLNTREHGRVVQVLVNLQEFLGKEGGQTGGENVDYSTGNDLIDLVFDGKNCVQSSH
ncbi:hypothetical protein SDC9_101636 [bioreactor metagenome]|uniref:Uncharacterized protein n=1 Tax=bioreactor metagenome TaxID=1076179 RepID=A0A645AVC5_9ZZZZ